MTQEENVLLLKLKEIDEKITKLYELKTKITEKLLGDSEEKIFVLKIEDLPKPFMRVTVISNKSPFKDKKIIYRVAPFTEVEAKIEFLKNEPK